MNAHIIEHLTNGVTMSFAVLGKSKMSTFEKIFTIDSQLSQ